MKSLKTNLSKAIIAFAVLCIATTISLDAQVKRVLLEQHTGAWCGWCTDGSYVMDKLIEKYPDRVVGVKWHNGDAMAIPEQGQFSQIFGITGYPTGTVDRKRFGNSVALSRGAWTQAAEQSMLEEPVVDVKTEYSYDAATQMISITVRATVLKNDSRQLAFNAMILEDNCTGTGSQWDQKNSLSGNPNFVGHPYYDQPTTIVGYKHMKVVRKIFGGVLGSTEKFPATVTAGQQYTQTFTFKKDASWKVENLYGIGFVQAFVTQGTSLLDGSILNVAEAGKLEVRASIALDNRNLLLTQGQEFTQNVKIRNPQDFNIQVRLTTGQLPSGWTASFVQQTLAVPAKGEATANMRILAPAGRATFQSIPFTVTPIATQPDATVIDASSSVNVLTDNTKYIFVGLNPKVSQFSNIIANTEPYKDKTVILPGDHTLLEAYPANLFEFVGFASDLNSRGAFATGDAVAKVYRDYIRACIENGTRVLIASELELYYGTRWTSASNDAKQLFASFGIEAASDPIPLITFNSQGQITGYLTADLKGIASDPITNGMAYKINLDAPNDANRRTYYCDNIRITNTSIASPILNYTDASGNVTGIAGAKMVFPNTRMVFLSYGFESTPDNVRNDLANKIMTWLFSTQTNEGAKITATSADIKFGEITEGNKQVTVKISNTGDEVMNISSISIVNDTKGAFSIVSGANVTSIPVGGSSDITVKFAPTESGDFTANLSIKSNAVNSNDLIIPLSGKATFGSVPQGTTADGLFTMNITPNPVRQNANFNYSFNGTTNGTLNIYVIDIAGRVVAELVNSKVAPGDYNLNFNSALLQSGTYYIIANINGKAAQIPVVIAK